MELVVLVLVLVLVLVAEIVPHVPVVA